MVLVVVLAATYKIRIIDSIETTAGVNKPVAGLSDINNKTTGGCKGHLKPQQQRHLLQQDRTPAAASAISFADIKKFTLVFPMQPLLRGSPTVPPAYVKAPMSTWNFTASSRGFIVLTRHEFPSLGVLTELMYFPGLFTPKQCGGKKDSSRYSAMRLWVDWPISMKIGR